MSRKEKEELIKSWKQGDGEVVSPAGDVEIGDSDLENVSGGHLAIHDTTSHQGTHGCGCGGSEEIGTCQDGTAGCCDVQ